MYLSEGDYLLVLNLVCSRRLKLSRGFRLFFNGQMKLNEFECNVGSYVFDKELPKRERKKRCSGIGIRRVGVVKRFY